MIHELWHYNFIKISGNDVNFSNIITALLVLVIGIKLAPKLSCLMAKLLANTLKENKVASNFTQKICLYTVYVLVVLLSLQVANIPLSIFAFIGGAVAIGFGFGVQGFMNNLISSIVLLLDAPIKVDDLIQINDKIGKVKFIDSRSVILETAEKEEIIIPSSEIIQKTISRWPNDKIIYYYLYIDVCKKENKINHEQIIKKLLLAASGLSFVSEQAKIEVFLTRIGANEDQFCLCFDGNSSINLASCYIRNEINFMLLATLKHNFSVTYPKNLTM